MNLIQRSRPTRARGLKLFLPSIVRQLAYVAPHAGAWIETFLDQYGSMVRFVAPHAGAWIETSK